MTHAEAARLHRIALAACTAAATEAAHEATVALWNAEAGTRGIEALRAMEWSKAAWATRGYPNETRKMGHEEAAKAHEAMA